MCPRVPLMWIRPRRTREEWPRQASGRVRWGAASREGREENAGQEGEGEHGVVAWTRRVEWPRGVATWTGRMDGSRGHNVSRWDVSRPRRCRDHKGSWTAVHGTPFGDQSPGAEITDNVSSTAQCGRPSALRRLSAVRPLGAEIRLQEDAEGDASDGQHHPELHHPGQGLILLRIVVARHENLKCGHRRRSPTIHRRLIWRECGARLGSGF